MGQGFLIFQMESIAFSPSDLVQTVSYIPYKGKSVREVSKLVVGHVSIIFKIAKLPDIGFNPGNP
jgi:hypothetical protein